MDNNNLSGQPTPNQPIMQPNMSPNMQNNMPPMDGQMNQMGQPMPMPQNMNQPYPQPMPMMKPPKQPMDPAKKKRIILIVSLVSGLAVAGIVAAVLIPILLKINYGPAYQTAKELKPNIYEIYQSYDCEYVIDYVDSSYTSTKTYGEYIEGCKEVYSSKTDDLIAKLENTDGVKRNSEIKNQFDKFKTEYSAISAGNSEELAGKLALWQAWHNMKVAANDLDYSSSSDAEFTTAANYLINSGNDTLKTYGENWLEKSLEVAAAYRTYRNTSWSSSDYNTNRNNYNNKRNELSDWVATNKPDINAIAPLSFDDTYKMYSEFNKLYDLIARTYEQNYNSGSNDCDEFLSEVYCE